MIKREYPLKIRPEFDFDLVAPRDRIVFFDIETTGVNRDYCVVYLIGLVVYEGGAWMLRQFFSQKAAEEKELLEAFNKELYHKKSLGRVILISYNGDAFDLPFIKKRMSAHGIRSSLNDGVLSLDLLRRIRPYRKLAGLEKCTLKSVERLFGIEREDKYSGGELIYVYEEYLRMSRIEKGMLDDNALNHKLKDHLLETLFLHNAEDISDMPFIMGVLGYGMLFEGDFRITQAKVRNNPHTARPVLDIRARLLQPLPVGIYREDDGMVLSISEEDPYLLNMTAELFEGELKYFFSNYKEYYYLPAEDMAVHKSVGEYVARSSRRQATASTCYQKKKGMFIPDPGGILGTAFYRERKGRAYGELTKVLSENGGLTDTNIIKSYILAVMKDMLKSPKA